MDWSIVGWGSVRILVSKLVTGQLLASWQKRQSSGSGISCTVIVVYPFWGRGLNPPPQVDSYQGSSSTCASALFAGSSAGSTSPKYTSTTGEFRCSPLTVGLPLATHFRCISCPPSEYIFM